MKKTWIGALLLLGGCASVEMAQYTVTSFPEVALTKDAKVQIVANGKAMEPVVETLKAEFAKNGGFKVVDGKANYWFVVSGLEDYVKSEPQSVLTVAKQEDAAGGKDVLTPATMNLASAAKGVSIAVYNAKTLAPVHYFEIPIYTGDNTAGAVRDGAVYSKAFAQDVVERVKDAFLTQSKEVQTPMPKKADGNLRELFSKRDYRAFLEAYKKIGCIDLKKFAEDVRTGTYQEGDVPQKLANYYLYLLVKETKTNDPTELKGVMEAHRIILRTSDDDGLAESVPVALARLEYKLANIGGDIDE